MLNKLPINFLDKRILISLVCILQTFLIKAQQQIVVKHLNYDFSPLAIMQDHDGYMWFGTDNGLQKYDGETFVNFNYEFGNQNSLASDEVLALYEDEHHHIWIASKNKVSIYQPKPQKFTHVNINLNKPAGLIRDQWDFIKCNGLLLIKSRATNTSYQYSKTKNAFVLHQKCNKHLKQPVELSNYEPVIYFTDRQQNIWKADKNLYVKVFGENSFKKVSGRNEKITFGKIFSIYQDREETIWLGTDNGIYQFNLLHQLVKYIQIPAKNYVPTSLSFINNKLWVGGFNNQISIFDEKFKFLNTIQIPSKKPAVVSCLIKNKDGNTLASLTDGSIWSINPNSLAITYYYKESLNNPLFFGAQNKNGKIWWTSSDGRILITDKLEKRWVHLGNKGKINQVVFDKDGNGWLSTSASGILKLDANGKIIKQFTTNKNNGLTSNEIGELRWKNDSILTMASSLGIQLLNIKTGKFKSITKKDGLIANPIINIIFKSADTLFYTTQFQLGVIALKENNFTRYGLNEGLGKQSYAFSGALTLPNGKIVFKSLQGLYYLQPTNYKIKKPATPIFTQIIVNDKKITISANNQLALNYNQDFIRFEFASLSYIDKENISYQYRLTGRDSKWINAGTSRFASYSNLKGGDYIFEVIAKNANGIKSDVKKFYFTIKKPYWQTWWFYSLAATIIITPIVFAIVQRIKRKTAVLKVKENIARDLHDGMGSTLSTIAILSNILKQQEKPEQELLNKIDALSRQTLNNMDDLVWSVKDSTNTLESLINRLETTSKELIYGTSIDFQFSKRIENEQQPLPIDLKYDILMIVKEAISNAVKHSQATKIILEISTINKLFTINIIDNGIGNLNAADENNGNGINNIKSRAKENNIALTISSKNEVGTVIKLIKKLA